MKKLAICIPNYNKIDCLMRLLLSCVEQIKKNKLYDTVQICISDDYSIDSPTDDVLEMIKSNPEIDIVYNRHDVNTGMDRNFHDSVMLSNAEFCWIVGNDDDIESDGISRALSIIDEKDADFYVTCFDAFSDSGALKGRVCPLNISVDEKVFDSHCEEDIDDLITHVSYDSGFFVFLSNLIFKRENWVKYCNDYMDKMNTMFIQVYIHVRTFIEGATYYYTSRKIIRNYIDDKTNLTIKRRSGMAIGLNDLVDTFFSGQRAAELKRRIVDCYISGFVWQKSEYLHSIRDIKSPKNDLYNKYFIHTENIYEVLGNKSVAIWGAGNYGNMAIDFLRKSEINIIGIFDADPNKIDTVIQGLYVKHIDDLWNKLGDDICIVVANHNHVEDMIRIIHEHGTSNIAIVT